MKGLYSILQGARAAIDRAWRNRTAKEALNSSHFIFSMDDLESRRMLSFGGGAVTISVNDVSAYPGNTTAGSETFTVSLNGPSTNTITVSWSTFNGSAKSGVDYTAGSGTLTFNPGVTSQTFSVALIPSLIHHPDRFFYVKLANSSSPNAPIAHGLGVGTILDNTPIVSVTAVSPTAIEGGVAGTFRFTRTGSTDVAVRVYYGIQGDAVNKVDYSRIGTSVTIASGSASADVTITPVQDNIDDGAKSVLLRIRKKPLYEIGTSPFATVEVVDNATAQITATVTKAPTVTRGSKGSYKFTVQYTAVNKLNPKSIASGNIQVTAPSASKYSPNAQLVSRKLSADRHSATAVYMVPAPNGTSGNGTYTIKMLANQVKDTAGTAVAAGAIGTFAVRIPDTIPPTAPTNLTNTAIDSASVSLSWTAATDNIGVTGYEVWRNGVKITTITGTSFKDSTAAPSTNYAYAVVAFDAAGNHSPISNTVTVETAPATPTALTAVAGGTPNSVHLTWKDNASDEDGFRVYNSSDGNNWTLLASVPGSAGTGATVAYDTSAIYSGKWYFRVSAFRGSVESVPSASVNLTV